VQSSHEALVSELRSELDRQVAEGEDRLDDAIHRLRQEKQDMSRELAKMKVSLSDKQSIIEALEQQQEQQHNEKRELHAANKKASEEKATLQQKYAKLAKAYRMMVRICNI
jgi:chromosome segregation ATPase